MVGGRSKLTWTKVTVKIGSTRHDYVRRVWHSIRYITDYITQMKPSQNVSSITKI